MLDALEDAWFDAKPGEPPRPNFGRRFLSAPWHASSRLPRSNGAALNRVAGDIPEEGWLRTRDRRRDPTPRIVFIDNYDSFTFNIAHELAREGADTLVMPHDGITTDELLCIAPDGIVLGPGPATPARSGVCPRVVLELGTAIPILGVCLGHQVIATALGGTVGPARRVMHGKRARIHHDGTSVFAHCPDPLYGVRYNSLAVDKESLPAALRVTATDDDGDVMAIAHRELPMHAVQFHPESIESDPAARIFGTWLSTLTRR